MKTHHIDSSLIVPEGHSRQRDEATKDICFKIFVIGVVILAAMAVVTGILALMSVNGALPVGMSSITHLSVIGEVNSYVMLVGGISLFILGILAWSCQLRKENQAHLISDAKETDIPV